MQQDLFQLIFRNASGMETREFIFVQYNIKYVHREDNSIMYFMCDATHFLRIPTDAFKTNWKIVKKVETLYHLSQLKWIVYLQWTWAAWYCINLVRKHFLTRNWSFERRKLKLKLIQPDAIRFEVQLISILEAEVEVVKVVLEWYFFLLFMFHVQRNSFGDNVTHLQFSKKILIILSIKFVNVREDSVSWNGWL